jgi:hypothetical protein
MPKRKDFKRRTDTTFTKRYGGWVYHFAHHKVDIPGYTSVTITVRRKKKDASRTTVGELVHILQFDKETD